ncbi:hypothetical protein TNCV_2338431 [Trichonephila clavipes]|nr:hypothetical protein TNCV_2338431 [Trichonephila clavipes]
MEPKAYVTMVLQSFVRSGLGLKPDFAWNPNILRYAPVVTLLSSIMELMTIVLDKIMGHETTPLRVKGDIEDVSSELDNGDKGCKDETTRILLLSAS